MLDSDLKVVDDPRVCHPCSLDTRTPFGDGHSRMPPYHLSKSTPVTLVRMGAVVVIVQPTTGRATGASGRFHSFRVSFLFGTKRRPTTILAGTPNGESTHVPNRKKPMPAISKKSKTKPTHLSYIVPATDDATDLWITQSDLDNAKKQRECVEKTREKITVNGYVTQANMERGDRHMRIEMMKYLASNVIVPHEGHLPGALAHTSSLTPVAHVDLSCASFRPPHLAFDEKRMLTQIMKIEKQTHDGLLRPFAEPHVQKRLRMIPKCSEFHAVTSKGIAMQYDVEVSILTGFGVLVVLGELRIPDDLLEEVSRDSKAITFEKAHINWISWGVDARRQWKFVGIRM